MSAPSVNLFHAVAVAPALGYIGYQSYHGQPLGANTRRISLVAVSKKNRSACEKFQWVGVVIDVVINIHHCNRIQRVIKPQ
jgi:hypothetical protein